MTGGVGDASGTGGADEEAGKASKEGLKEEEVTGAAVGAEGC